MDLHGGFSSWCLQAKKFTNAFIHPNFVTNARISSTARSLARASPSSQRFSLNRECVCWRRIARAAATILTRAILSVDLGRTTQCLQQRSIVRSGEAARQLLFARIGARCELQSYLLKPTGASPDTPSAAKVRSPRRTVASVPNPKRRSNRVQSNTSASDHASRHVARARAETVATSRMKPADRRLSVSILQTTPSRKPSFGGV